MKNDSDEPTTPARRKASWDRYWRAMRRWDSGAPGPYDLYADRLLEIPRHARWLDAGCGRHWLPAWRRSEAGPHHPIGCDVDRGALARRVGEFPVCAAQLGSLPFAAATFDYVSSNMVFEHLDEPATAVAELVRVTRVGGRILVHTVNARHYIGLLTRLTPFWLHHRVVARIEGRRSEDVYPTRYRANTRARLCQLFGAAGCRMVWGGEVADLPVHVPVPGLFWVALGVGLLERRLSRFPPLRSLLCSNLLIEFERVSESAVRGRNVDPPATGG